MVIAIIGILSSVVLASLNSARAKGNDAKIKSQVSNIRSTAEIYRSTNGNYGTAITDGICATSSGYMFSDTESGMIRFAEAINPITTTNSLSCYVSEDGLSYAVADRLTAAGTYWCADSMGISKEVTNALSTSTCPEN